MSWHTVLLDQRERKIHLSLEAPEARQKVKSSRKMPHGHNRLCWPLCHSLVRSDGLLLSMPTSIG